MSRDWRQYLDDIAVNCDRVIVHTRGLTFEDYRTDDLVHDAVMHNLYVIGEAANHIPEDFRRSYPEVEWNAIIGLRNRIAHGYYDLVERTIWATVSVDIPFLRARVQQMLADAERGDI